MTANKQYDLVARSLAWVAEHQAEQPSLECLSDAMAVSPYHLQRTFRAWAGVSPKQFLKSLTRKAALERLSAGRTVLDAAIESGLSGPGRLHDLMISTEGMTPGEIRRHGAGVVLQYGYGMTPFGDALICWSQRGISFLAFCAETGDAAVSADLANHWKNARFEKNAIGARKLLDRIFSGDQRNLRLCLIGTPFQLMVWEALLRIPVGTHASYGQIARLIGRSKASRAVGTAIGRNPVAWIIPCHRVIREVGAFGAYRWGRLTKQAMIGYEAARLEQANESGAQSRTDAASLQPGNSSINVSSASTSPPR